MPQTTEELLQYLAQQPSQPNMTTAELLQYLAAQPAPPQAVSVTNSATNTGIPSTIVDSWSDYYGITSVELGDGLQNLSPSEYGITAPENMNVEPLMLSCQEKVNAWCAFNPDKCIYDNGNITPMAGAKEIFLQSYPECFPSNNAPVPPSVSNNSEKMSSETFDLKSPNFLGGNNVHNVIIIVLLLLVLVVTTKGSLFTAPIKAIKQAV